MSYLSYSLSGGLSALGRGRYRFHYLAGGHKVTLFDGAPATSSRHFTMLELALAGGHRQEPSRPGSRR